MPMLLLTARQTDDTQKLWRACIAENWTVDRLHNWRVPEVRPEEAAVYGEALFAHPVAQTLGLTLIEPPVEWLPLLAYRWRRRGGATDDAGGSAAGSRTRVHQACGRQML